MDLLIGVLWLLLYIVVIGLVFFLITWALKLAFPAIPERAIQLIWLIGAILALIYVVSWLANGAPPNLPRALPLGR